MRFIFSPQKTALIEPIQPSISIIGNLLSLFSNKKDINNLNFKFYDINKNVRERNNCYTFGYLINKLKHNMSIRFDPIMIAIPENVKTNKIVFNCSFTHNEPGTIKNQSLEIIINKVIRGS